MAEKLIPSSKDKEKAQERIKLWLDFENNESLAAEKIRQVLEIFVQGIESAYASRNEEDAEFLDDNDIPKFLVDMTGIELFQGDSGRLLRKHLLEKM